MSCPEPDRVLDYLAHRLDAAGRGAIELHVDECATCRVLLVELAQSGEGLRVSDPETVGRYRIEARLGEGGMGTVYAAHDPQLDRKVAIKLVHAELAERGGADRLVREGRSLAKLTHPNVVAVHDAGLDGDRVYIAMELVDGETLASWLATPRTWRAILDKFVAAGRGLAAAHAAGVIHRDVKPENVLVDRAGVPKVADFGLADSSPVIEGGRRIPGDRITRPGGVVGTPAFMSPEQRRGGDVGPSTDQYSLCAAIAGALDRRPRWLERVLARGMASDPAERYPSLAALVAALDPLRHARRRTIAIAGVLALGIAAGAIAILTRPGERDPLAVECDLAIDERFAMWSGDDRAAIANAMRATGLAFAHDTIRHVGAAGDDYAMDIRRGEGALCVASAGREELLALRAIGLECLANRRSGFRAVIARLRAAGPLETRTGVALVHELANVEECSNVGALEAELAAQTQPALFVARLESTVATRQVAVAYRAGRYDEALRHGVRAVERARVVGGATLVNALIHRGELAMLAEGFAAGEAAFLEAVEVAETAHADALRALAMANLMQVRAKEPGREREALAMRPLVEAAVDRVGKRTPLRPMMLLAAGSAQLHLGEYDAAVASFKAALAEARALLPPGDPRLPEYIYPVGIALGYQRKDREALEYHAEAHRVAIAAWGTGHPNAERYAINLAFKRAALGECAMAMPELARVRGVFADLLPPDSSERLSISEVIGTCHMLLGDHAQALREHEARREVLRAAGREHSTEMAQVLLDLGDTHLAGGDHTRALEPLRGAVAVLEPLVGITDSRLGLPLAHLGDAELRAGHRERAIELLERALTVFRADTPAATLADAKFPLARALANRDGRRARELATAARTGYIEGGPVHARQLAEVEAWLRAH